MIHTAKRLIPFAKNKVIHVDEVTDPVLKRIVRNRKLTVHLRNGLKQIDDQYELLIPYQVEDEEMQLKRYIQWKLGTTVNLTTLRVEYSNYYKKLYDYGSPVDVIRRWGLTPIHSHTLTEEGLLEAVQGFSDESGAVTGISSQDPRLYRSLKHHASKNGLPIIDYLATKGIIYKG